jgi:hypothetical protein
MEDEIVSGREHAYEGHGGYPRPNTSSGSATKPPVEATLKSSFTGKRTSVDDEVARFTGQLPTPEEK